MSTEESISEIKKCLDDPYYGLKQTSNTNKNRCSILAYVDEAISSAREEALTDQLQRQRGVLGKYNCGLGCEFQKAYHRLTKKELELLSNPTK